MKILAVVFLCLGISLSSFSQNPPEFIAEFNSGNRYYFNLISDDNYKIVAEFNGYFDLYNLDFSLYSTVSVPTVVGSSYYIWFITSSLFDCDSTQLEFLVNADTGNSETQGVYVFREDGTQLFFEQGYRLNNISMNSLTSDPVRSAFAADSLGTYLIFAESAFAGSRKMYRFCGQLPVAKRPQAGSGVSGGRPQPEMNPGLKMYPNPTGDYITIEYPDLQGHRHARAEIWSLSGTLVRSVDIGRAFSEVRMDVSSLAQGTYIARIVAGDGLVLQEKFVKVNR